MYQQRFQNRHVFKIQCFDWLSSHNQKVVKSTFSCKKVWRETKKPTPFRPRLQNSLVWANFGNKLTSKQADIIRYQLAL